MTLYEYILQLLNLNRSRLDSFRNHRYYASVLVGIAEEMQEFYNKARSSSPELIYEAGDVLAYVVLSTAARLFDSHRSLESLAKATEQALSAKLFVNDPTFPEDVYKFLSAHVETLLGRIKRYFRENEPIDALFLADCFFITHLVLLHTSKVSFSEIAQANIEKLTNRANKGTLFVGSGDSR